MPSPNFYYTGDCSPNYFPECLAAFWIWRLFPITLVTIGTVGNVFNILVLSRKQLLKHSTSTYLLALAITELLVLWTSLVPDTVISITGTRIVDISMVTCRLRWWIALTSGSFSTWIIVLLTLERMLLTKAPIFSRKHLTPRKALIASLIVVLTIALSNSHMVYGMRYYDINLGEINHTGQNVTVPMVPFKCYFTSMEYAVFYMKYWASAIFIIHNIIPAGIIVVGNLNIAAVLLYRQKKLARVNPSTNTERTVRRRSMVKLLFILSGFYILTTTPWCVFYALKGKVTDHNEEGLAKWQLVSAIVNTLIGCNFSFNFFFYFLYGNTLFRTEWKRLVEKIKNGIRNSLQTTTGSDS